MLKIKSILLMALLTLVCGNATSANTDEQIRKFNLNQINAPEFFQALGYLEGQKQTIQKIEENYPSSLLIPKFKFQSVFPDLQTKMVGIAKTVMGESEFENFYIGLQQEISNHQLSTKIDDNFATQFHNELLSRSEGNIESPVLETFLSVLYFDQPQYEFLKGYKKKFSSLDHSKSKGVHVEFDLPKSWIGKEGKRPNVIQQWTSQNGYGSEFINLVIKDLGSHIATDREIVEIFEDKATLQQMVPGLDLKRTYLTKIEKQNAIFIEAAGPVKRGAFDFFFFQNTTLIFFGSKILIFTCGTSAKSQEVTYLGGELIRPICDLITNSVVFPKLYKVVESETINESSIGVEQEAGPLVATQAEQQAAEAISTEAQRKIAVLSKEVSALRSQIGSLQAILGEYKRREEKNNLTITRIGSELNSALAKAASEVRKNLKLEAQIRELSK